MTGGGASGRGAGAVRPPRARGSRARLTFEPDGHVYRWAGRQIPSVTQVLQAVGMRRDLLALPPSVLEVAGQRGTVVHEACALLDSGRLDWASVDPEVLPRVQAWQAFCRDTDALVLASEQPVVDADRRYAGTLDRRLAMRGHAAVVCELKATAAIHPSAAIQLAAYARCLDAPHERLVVQLRGDGTYRTAWCRAPEDAGVWLAALAVYEWVAARVPVLDDHGRSANNHGEAEPSWA